MTKEEGHDLSHKVFYHKNGYSLFRPIRGMDCKDAVHTPLHREKAANSAGGIHLKYEADLEVGRLYGKKKNEGTMKNTVLTVLFLSLLTLITSCRTTKMPFDSKTTTTNTPMAIKTPRQTDSPIQPLIQETPTLKSGNTPDVIEQDEQSIYSLFLGNSAGKIVIVRDETFGDSYSQNEQETRSYITSNLLGISSETVNSYLLQNAIPSKLPANMNLGVNYVLVSTPEFLEITGKSNWRDIWKQKYPNSETSCIIFSRVGFNNSHTQALIYVTRLWVDGGYYLLEYNAGNWEIIKSFSNVIIN